MESKRVIAGKIRTTMQRIRMISNLYGNRAPSIGREMSGLHKYLRRNYFRERIK